MTRKFIMVIAFLTISIIILMIFNVFIKPFYNKKNDIDYESEEKFILNIYNKYPDIFNFNDEGIAKVYLRIFTDGYKTKTGEVISTSTKFDNNLNECDGYYLIFRNYDKIEVDFSHICDMLNY